MGYQAPVFDFSYPANVDMSSEASFQFTAVKLIAASGGVSGAGVGGAALAHPSAGGAILGILQNNPFIGEAGEVEIHGISQAKLSGVTAIGQILMVDANGLFLPATAGNYGVAMALETGAVGDISTVLLMNFGKQ